MSSTKKVKLNKEMYINIFRRLRDAVRRKRPGKWRTNSWFLLQDNAPAHQSALVKDFLTKNNVTTLEHPSYSLDVAAADIYLFSRLKSALKERCLCYGIAEKAFTEWLLGSFLTIFQLFTEHTFTQGEHFEGNVASIIVLFCISGK
jgi:hypothetical protein